ncbi:hypothetical protein BH11GEM2_BH11GEM2_31250 [soil metagenome]
MRRRRVGSTMVSFAELLKACASVRTPPVDLLATWVAIVRRGTYPNNVC